jgi:hypothetical protein
MLYDNEAIEQYLYYDLDRVRADIAPPPAARDPGPAGRVSLAQAVRKWKLGACTPSCQSACGKASPSACW